MLRIFTPVKIQRLRPGLNPQTWVPEARMLTTRPPKPLDMNVNLNLSLSVVTDYLICLTSVTMFSKSP